MAHQARGRAGLAAVCLAAAVLLLGGCGDDGAAGTSGGTSTTGQDHSCAVAERGAVTIVAKDLAWDVACLQAPEGDPLTITIDNRDADVNHNLHITDLPGGPRTELRPGPSKQRLELPAGLAAGEYGYVCDIHPNMTGTLELLAPVAEPGE
jgi:plastocyanin